ncbi:hypothetical protein [Riemerella anatipestifer]|uniref:hypothetical protein n=1 Tax=Riemerella anatipestifer TaxID=34085 RepID=UPI00129ECEBB|nr:hypothetical protein [Riemerella anatipestifer]MRM84284.1 hypothetical protein [Riemerella anatipestifer]
MEKVEKGLAIDLRPFNKWQKHQFINSLKEKYKVDYTTVHKNFKIGDVVEFYGGYYNHILYRTEIIGFDQSGNLYVLWDCYWFPVKQERILRTINTPS